MQSGRLIIATDVMQWSYEVKGTHPEYKAPAGAAKVSTRLDAKVNAALDRTEARRKEN